MHDGIDNPNVRPTDRLPEILSQSASGKLSWLRESHTAVIIGGANGISRSVAETFLAHGMQVVIADNNEDALATTAHELSEHHHRLETITCDVRS